MKQRKSILEPVEVESHLRDYQLAGVDLMSNYILELFYQGLLPCQLEAGKQ